MVEKDYLNIKEDFKIDSNLIGFYSLSNKEKEIVIKLIEFMNTQKHNN